MKSKKIKFCHGLICVLLGVLPVCFGAPVSTPQEGVVFPMVEISFRLTEKTSNPFAQEWWGWIENSSGDGIWLPAYYDGNEVWKIRVSPRAKAEYRVKIFFGGEGERQPREVQDLKPSSFVVEGKAQGPGLVRINPNDPQKFIREDGTGYFPVGLNVGWDMGEQGDVVAFLERLVAAEGNWSRIWMCHWDDKNLDWPQGRKLALGEIDPAAAAKWDRIVAAADRLQIPFQMVLQHHGQYSTEVNANWNDNPWNKANGGFLNKAEDFFTDLQARTLTRRKYRYIVARYGYSPSIMAWELFNEVEFTDAGKTAEGRTAIREWHEEMAAYLRSIDPYRHLITTSSPSLKEPVWNVVDYYQIHLYPPDPLSGSGGFNVSPLALGKPIFYGEIGSSGDGGQTPGEGGRTLRDILWGGIFSGAGATAQYWAWDQTDREKLYPLITAMARFSKQAGLGDGLWRPVHATVSTTGWSDLVFGPGQRWDSVVDPRLNLAADGSGRPVGTGFSSTLRPRRGSGEREGTDAVTFQVGISKPVRWEVTVNEVANGGASLELEADGKQLAEKAWEPAANMSERKELPLVLGVEVPEGTKILKIKSTGADYFQISSVRLKDYTPQLGVRGMTNDRNTVLWVYRGDGLEKSPLKMESATSAQGTIHAEGLLDGKYHVLWWDTLKAVAIREEECVVEKGRVDLATPPISADAAVLLVRRSL